MEGAQCGGARVAEHVRLHARNDVKLRVGGARTEVRHYDVTADAVCAVPHGEVVFQGLLVGGVAEGVVCGELRERLAHYHQHLRLLLLGHGGKIAYVALDLRFGVALGLVDGVEVEVVEEAVVEAQLVKGCGDVVVHADGEGVVGVGVAVYGEEAAREYGGAEDDADDARQQGPLFGFAQINAQKNEEGGGQYDEGDDAVVHVKAVLARGVQSLPQKGNVGGDEGVVASVDLQQVHVAHQAENQVVDAAGKEAV